MPLSKEIKEKIDAFSRARKNLELVNYLEDVLTKGEASAKDIFEYADKSQCTKEKPPRYVIDEETINMLGVVVSKLEDASQKKYAVQFYMLAAKRGSAIGNRNCVRYFLNGDAASDVKKSPSQALTYAQAAVDLAKKKKENENEHKYWLARALHANGKDFATITLPLKEYIEFKSKDLRAAKEGDKSDKKKALQHAIALCEELLKKLVDLVETKSNLDKEKCKVRVSALNVLIKCDVPELSSLRQTANYIKGKFQEVLEDRKLAMAAYCLVTDEKNPYYVKAIEARARLLKEQVVQDSQGGYDADAEKEEKEDETLLDDIPFDVSFDKSWKKEFNWLYSVDEAELRVEYEERLSKLDTLISGVETKIALIESQQTSEKLKAANASLEKEKGQLAEARENLDKKYEEFKPANRQRMRRHAVERRFFNPRRSSKQDALTQMTSAMIDQRLRPKGVELEPVQLTGTSVRLVLTAERAFQQAAMELAGHSPMRCIPIAREKAWSAEVARPGSNKFGPVEHYQVDETDLQTEHRVDPKPQRLGDSFLPQHRTYNLDVYPFLERISEGKKENEKKLAGWMIRYGKKHQGISLEELSEIYPDADQRDIDHFNRLCFLIMEKEQGQWHSATEKRFQLGMMVAQARCLIMVEAGFISFEEAFKNDVAFGVYSKKEIVYNPSNVSEACENIEKLYIEYLKTKYQDDYLKFFKRQMAEKTDRVFVLTRHQAHEDLQHVYGGESDTDEEGYQSDLSLSS